MFLIALLRLKDAIATSVFIYKMRQHDTIIHAAAFYSASLYIAVARRPVCAMFISCFSAHSLVLMPPTRVSNAS